MIEYTSGDILKSEAEAFVNTVNCVGVMGRGIESPFGMELLSTVHWVMKHEGVSSTEDIVNRVHAWSSRKQQFTARQIGIAADVLTRKGWTAAMAA